MGISSGLIIRGLTILGFGHSLIIRSENVLATVMMPLSKSKSFTFNDRASPGRIPCRVRKVNIGLSGSGMKESILSWVSISVHLGGAFNIEIVGKPCGLVLINSNSTI